MSMFSVRLCPLHVRLHRVAAARASGFPKEHRHFTRIASAIQRTRSFLFCTKCCAEALRQVPEVLCKIVQMLSRGNSMPYFSTTCTVVRRATAFGMMMTSNSTPSASAKGLLSCLPAACLPANVFKMNLNNWQMPSAAVVACQPFFFAACWPPVCGKRQLYPERFLPKT